VGGEAVSAFRRKVTVHRFAFAGALLVAGVGLLVSAPSLGQVKGPPVKVDKCTLCHMRDFKMKRGASGPITLAAKQEGKFCGACHDGKTQLGGVVVFPIDECDRCHK
jgi:c(7)-type cytochrome triheme protein